MLLGAWHSCINFIYKSIVLIYDVKLELKHLRGEHSTKSLAEIYHLNPREANHRCEVIEPVLSVSRWNTSQSSRKSFQLFQFRNDFWSTFHNVSTSFSKVSQETITEASLVSQLFKDRDGIEKLTKELSNGGISTSPGTLNTQFLF